MRVDNRGDKIETVIIATKTMNNERCLPYELDRERESC